MWLQNPPRVQWVVILNRWEEHGSATVRSWFEPSEYGPDSPPPAAEVRALAEAMGRIAEAALEASPFGETRYQVKVYEQGGIEVAEPSA